MKTLKSKITKQNRRRMRRRIISILTAVVVFLTTYALVLPAITMDTETAAQEPGIEIAQPAPEAVVSEPAPVQAEPIAAEPVAAEPVAQPAAEPVVTEPAAAEPIAAEPVVQPAADPAAAGADNAAMTAVDASAGVSDASGDSAVVEIADGTTPLAAPDAAASSGQEGENTTSEEENQDKNTETETDEKDKDDEENEEEKKLAVSPLVYDNAEYTVKVSFEESAQIPDGTTLSWREFGAGSTEYSASRMILNNKMKENGIAEEDLEEAISSNRFFEVLFIDKNGVQFLPADAVDVLVEYKDAANANVNNQVPAEGGSLYAVTFRTADGQPTKANLITTNAKDGSAGLEAAGGFIRCLRVQDFPANDYHTNAVIGQVVVKDTNVEDPEFVTTLDDEEEEESLTTQYLTADGEAYNITLTYGPEAGIPDDVVLEVSEIVQASDTYEEYVSKTENALDPAEKVVFARFFDIKIMKDGAEIQPNGAVNVKIELADELTEEVKVVHFEHNDAQAVPEAIDTPVVLDSARVEAEALENAVGFETESFSVFGVVETETITVPFTASDGSTYEVTVNYDSEAGITENAELIVSEVTENSSKYDSYVNQAAEAIDSKAADLQYVKLLDISIVDENGSKIILNKPVDVQIKLLDKEQAEETTQVVHFEGSEETPVVMESTVDGDTVNFSTNGFSIYAVVDEGDDGDYARMNLHFMNGNTEVAMMIVKNGDTREELDHIIYDPGVGEILEGTIFKGWWYDEDDQPAEDGEASYAVADAENGMDIDDVRDWAATYSIKENDDVYIYAMLYKNYVINYLDENNVGVGSENIFMLSTDTTSPYTVNMAYTPKDDTHAFLGWKVSSGRGNVSNASYKDEDGNTVAIDTTDPDAVYPNGTTMTISGNVTFSVNAPEGHWLVFNENGKGGTYNAPKFLETNDVTERPRPDSEMTRYGYTFGGWYTAVTGTADENGYTPVDESTAFTFGNTINDKTTLYAKWTPAATANYTVSIWKQNVEGDGYDFYESVSLTGNTNTVIDTVIQQGTGQDAYARIDGTDYNAAYTKTVDGKTTHPFEGFYLKEFDQDVTITPEGDAILNVYYDRAEYTLRFFYARSYDYSVPASTNYNQIGTTSNNGTPQGFSYDSSNTYYGYRNGQYIQLYYRSSNGRFYRNAYYTNSYSGNVYLLETTPAGTRTYIQVNANNEGFLRHNGGTLERSLAYYLTNDYQRLTNGNTWKDVNNSQVNGNPLNLISSEYLAKPEVSTDSIRINGVTTDVSNGSSQTGGTSRQTVDTTYYYLDVKVRYGQSLDDLWPNPETTFIAQQLTAYNRRHIDNEAETSVTPLLTGSWASGNNISGMYHQMTTDLFEGDEKIAYFDTYWRIQEYYHYRYNVYFSVLEGETGDVTYNEKQYVLHDSYVIGNGVGWGAFPSSDPYPADGGYGYHDVAAVTFDGTSIAGRVDSQTGVGVDGTINVYYDRYVQKIIYNDGIYVDGNNNPLQNQKEQQLHTQSVIYGTDLTSYNIGESNYWRPSDTDEYVFEGWYLDSEGQNPYTFSGTMPQHDIMVYAKWRQIQYRVFLHPNADQISDLDWGSEEQSLNFRISYGDKVDTPEGRSSEWQFVGWYTDPDCSPSSLFTEDMVLNKSTVTTPYDKTTDFTDPMDKWGNGATWNSDAIGNNGSDRFWITKKLDLYGKWRAKLVGANGIGVVYNAVDGTNAPTDTNQYLDQAQATAQAASTAPEGQQFVRWIVQTWDSTAGGYVDKKDTSGNLIGVYPGDSFDVLKSDAKYVITGYINPNLVPGDEGYGVISPTQDETHTEVVATYTVQLRAEYVDTGAGVPTHIEWYGNNETTSGNNFVVSDTNVMINSAIDVKPASTFTYEGHTFLGWARVPISDDEGEALNPTLESKLSGNNLSLEELGVPDLFLKYNASTGKFEATSVTTGATVGNTVSKVAPDERHPKHAMVAVWEVKTYDVTIQKTVINGSGSDLTQKFEIGYSYGATPTTGTVNLANTETQTLTAKIPYGTVITVSETGYDNFEKTYSAQRTTEPDGTMLDSPVTVDATSTGAFTITGNTTITVTNTRKVQDVVFEKTLASSQIDGDNSSVTGAVFTLSDGTNTYTSSPVGTALIGTVTFTSVPFGTYTLSETTAPTGYAKIADHTVVVDENGFIIKLGDTEADKNASAVYTIDNPKSETGTVTLMKVNEDGSKQLSGATFEISALDTESDKYLNPVTIKNVGSQTISNLVVGTKFKLKETSAPDGYILLGDEFYFQIKLDGTVQITDENGAVITDYSDLKISLNDKTISIKNESGQALPNTGGPGTLLYTLGGIALIIASALMYGFRMRRRERRSR